MLKKRPQKSIIEINVVPYIDIMLVLLVIFMVTAPLLQQGVSVDLPNASAKSLPSADVEPIVVSVNKDGAYFLNVARNPSLAITKKNLILRISAELKRNPGRKVLVKGDQNVAYGRVVEAMVVIQQSGVAAVGLITQDNSDTINLAKGP